MAEHTSKRFETSLEGIRSEFLRMGGIVEQMIHNAVDSIDEYNGAVIESVLEQETVVNELEVALDSEIAEVLALQQPIAIDLRLLLSVSKMITDLERCGDEAEKIAKTVRRVNDSEHRFEPVVELSHIGKSVSNMLHKVLDAFARGDAVAAAEVVKSDKKVDKEWKAIVRSLNSYVIEDPRLTSLAIDLLFIARSCERIGDHAKNMGERIIYYVQGEDVRHTGAKNAVKVAKNGEQTPKA